MTARAEVDLATLIRVDRLLTDHGLQYLLYGGWGLDIIRGVQSRPHGDVDLFCWQRDYYRLRSALIAHGCSGYELPGRHLAVKAPFRADIVFLDDPGTGPVIGTTSVFEVRLPRRALREWRHGVVAGHRLPVGCVELVVRVSGHSPNSHACDRALVSAITAGCDHALLREIRYTRLRYDRSAAWLPLREG